MMRERGQAYYSEACGDEPLHHAPKTTFRIALVSKLVAGCGTVNSFTTFTQPLNKELGGIRRNQGIVFKFGTRDCPMFGISICQGRPELWVWWVGQQMTPQFAANKECANWKLRLNSRANATQGGTQYLTLVCT